jgi:hypothetical protein
VNLLEVKTATNIYMWLSMVAVAGLLLFLTPATVPGMQKAPVGAFFQGVG